MAAYTNGTNRLSAAQTRLRSLSPKTVAAAALMAVMGLMWVRVLMVGKTPATAQAAESAIADTPAAASTAPARVVPSPLPLTAGRNDVLTRDFFVSNNWPGFGQTAKTAPQASGQEMGDRQRQAFIAGLEKTLTLEAIIQAAGDAPARACIEGKVLAAGQYFVVKNGSETYELAVSDIGDEQVVLTCDRQRIILKMPPSERVD